METISLFNHFNSKVILIFTLSVLMVTMNHCYSNKNIEGLVLSEFMADNDSALKDSLGGYRDWIEIHNQSDQSINLKNVFISNDRSNLLKTRLPDLELLPNNYIVFFATSNDSITNNLGFKLNKESGEIILSLSDGQTILDEVKYKNQFSDISYSRINNEWVWNANPTPAKKNSMENYYTNLSGDVDISFLKVLDKIQVEIKAKCKGDIKFTLDGSSPLEGPAWKYIDPFEVDTNTVVRAFVEGKQILKFKDKKGVFVDASLHSLPVISLITDSANLWDPEIGVYVLGNNKNYTRKGEEWIRPGTIDITGFTDELITTEVDFKVYGSGTRIRPKKSITILPKNGINNHFFNSFEEENIDGFVLRACYSDASRYKNELVNNVNQIMNSKLLMQEYHPVVVYINGTYWGLFNLSERKNSAFIQRHSNQKPKYIHNANARSVKVVKGKTEDYRKLLDSLNSIDMNDPGVFDFIKKEFDLESLLDFVVQESYTNKPDRFNNRFWKAKRDSSKWRYIGYDFDVGFVAPANNRIDRQLTDTIAQGISIVGRLMMNKEFQNAFFERTCDYLNFGYTEKNVAAILESVDSLVFDEFKLDYKRWKPEFDRSLDSPVNQKLNISNYINPRREFLLNEVAASYGFVDQIEFVVPENGNGKLKINNYYVDSKATYFTNMELYIQVEPNEGYVFTGWENGYEKVDMDGVYDFNIPMTLTPVFKLK